KAGRTDVLKPGSWRPGALLSCLGKGLERLIARRIFHLTILERVTSPIAGETLLSLARRFGRNDISDEVSLHVNNHF
ncbi:hypothetical protein LZ31DRAFT_481719, partial [Colletotrichum somersetense]